VTDVYLATLALHHHARLVTFDHSVAWQAVAGATPDLLLTLA
jgi:predicted nucleic acid-binding protein